jgi:hypothetical protein
MLVRLAAIAVTGSSRFVEQTAPAQGATLL